MVVVVPSRWFWVEVVSVKTSKRPGGAISWPIGGQSVDNQGRVRHKRALFSSLTVEWATPKALYDELNKEFRFNFDPCPLGGKEDGTLVSWRGKRVFCNPPYGPGIRKFLDRWQDADLAVYLLPARTDTAWFHEVVLPLATEIRFLRGRLKFGETPKDAPFPSVIVVFDRGRVA